ncbi:MAG: hypothetical protein U9R75_04860, partial [Candidatus Thermoplasmatota archaeon]|nr:hypothetical protein [Candidatus Thermoplasmatota archaeon]
MIFVIAKHSTIIAILCLLISGLGVFGTVSGNNDKQDVFPTLSPLFAGGDGSAGNPYQISNVTELQWMGNTSDLGKHFILINDIDA